MTQALSNRNNDHLPTQRASGFGTCSLQPIHNGDRRR